MVASVNETGCSGSNGRIRHASKNMIMGARATCGPLRKMAIHILDHGKPNPLIIPPNELVVLTPSHLNSEVGDAPTGEKAIRNLPPNQPCRSMLSQNRIAVATHNTKLNE